MSSDSPSLRDHLAWLGYLQPDGLVVSATALVDAQVVLDHHTLPALQERFADFVNDESSVENFAAMARHFLEWPDDCLFTPGHPERPLPPELIIPLPELGESLAPAMAFRDPRAKDPAQPWLLLIGLLPADTDLDALPAADSRAQWIASASRRFERLLRETHVPVGLLSNGTHFRLFSAPRGENTGHVTFPVAAMREVAGRPILGAFHLLLDRYRLLAAPTEARLPALLQRSRQYQGRVSATLAGQVLDALYELLRGFGAADAHTGGALLKEVVARRPNDVYDGLLTILLRLVFLLFAEDRGLLPQSNLFSDNYSVHGLFERLRADAERYPDTMDQRFGAWTGLLAAFRAAHGGCRHPQMSMPARRGHLFDPARFPFLEGGTDGPPPLLSDGVVFRILERLLLLEGERLSYRTLDVEQIGSVYQTMIGFGVEVARGVSIALRPAKSGGAPAFLDLDALLGVEPGKRAEALQCQTDHKLAGAAAATLKSAGTVADLLAALEKKIARRASPVPVQSGSLLLQPTDERRRSGSHYTPRALTAPIVRKTFEPIFARLGESPTPQQILDLKVCDLAVGSGAFLVEACRQLGDALVTAWARHGGKPVIPPDEDEVLHARRLVAQRCLYGVDRNPMATDLAKLSLWLATLAKDHPFTFLDHSLRTGDALVGLSKRQIAGFHWDLSAREAKERQFGQQALEHDIELATSHRREILEGGDYMLPALKAQRLALADAVLDRNRRVGDLCLAAFFTGDKPKTRAVLRGQYLDALLDIQPGKPFDLEMVQKVNTIIAQLRESTPHSVVPFHWEIEFPEVFRRENGGFDAFVGNPPYGGKNTVGSGNRVGYLDWLKVLHEESHGNADLVAHFYRRAFGLLRGDGCFGLIATNTICQGDTRQTGLRWICVKGSGTIYAARRRYRWVGAAAVVVSVVWVAKGTATGPFDLDGNPVTTITAFLFHDGGHESPESLASNADKSFQGSIVLGMGFTFDDTNQKGVTSSPRRDAQTSLGEPEERRTDFSLYRRRRSE